MPVKIVLTNEESEIVVVGLPTTDVEETSEEILKRHGYSGNEAHTVQS